MFPELYHHGSFVIHTYGLVLMVAFLVALGRAFVVARRQQDPAINPDSILDVGIWMIGLGVVGARLLFVLLEWPTYRADPASILKVWEGGLSFHGGLIGGFVALIGYCLLKRISILKVADIFAPSVMIAYAIGRVGCFLNGCCYGAPTSLPWGVRFHDENILTVPSHPTQLYATALSLVFFAVLVWMEKRRAYYGQIACWYILFASVERFVMEIWRAGTTSDVVAHVAGFGLTDVQLLCLGMATVAVVGMVILRRRPKHDLTTPRPLEAAVR